VINFVYLKSYLLKLCAFCLDSCIANKGEKFELEMAYWMHLEGFQVVSSHFWALLHTGLTYLTGQSVGPVHMLPTGLTGGVDRSDWSGLSCCSCPVSKWCHAYFRPGGLHWFRESLHV
jgi:hypothetical protein